MQTRRPSLTLTFDLDEWYHCRWATGSQHSLWPDTAQLFRDVYRSDSPAGELIEPTAWLLEQLGTRGLRATFFVLGEVGRWYPHLIRRIAGAGHEIACHGMHHVDMTTRTERSFTDELAAARDILEDLAGKRVVGFRAPNFVVAPYLGRVLRRLGFTYDSSVCPAWSILRRDRYFAGATRHPYQASADDLSLPGHSGLIELPVSVQQGVALPGGTGIMARVVGRWWARSAIDCRLRKGSAMFYCHPYELTPAVQACWPKRLPWRVQLFLRRTGDYLRQFLIELMNRNDVDYVSAGELAHRIRAASSTLSAPTTAITEPAL